MKAASRRTVTQIVSRIDLAGIIGFAGALTALLVFLLSLPNPDWIALAVAVIAAAGLVTWELRAATPFFDVHLLATNRPLTLTYLRFGLTMLGMYTIMYGISQWLEGVRGYSPEETLVTLLFGILSGTTAVGNQAALYAQAPDTQIGTAAGLLRTFGYLGSVASSAITSIVFHTINPARAALLVMDYQPAVLGAFPDNDALLGRVARAIAVARSHSLLVGYVRVGFDDDDYANMPETNKTLRGVAAGRHMHHKDPVTAVHPRLAPQPGDLEVRKSRIGAFSTTDLDDQLRARHVHTLILAGIRTGGVVLTTMREAADRDYQVYVLEDGSADVDAEVHDVLTQKIFPQQGYVVSIDQFAGLLPA